MTAPPPPFCPPSPDPPPPLSLPTPSRPAIVGGAGFHNLPPPSFPCGKSTAMMAGPSPIGALLRGAFQPPELPPRPPTAAADERAARLRAATHGKPSDAHTAAALVMAADRASLLPTSGDTGYLDTSGLRRRDAALSRRDTRGSALLRSARSAGVPYAGGALMSARDLAATRARAGAAGGAGGADTAAAAAAAGGAARPAPSAGFAPLAGAKSALWGLTSARANFDGRPGATVRYSGYTHPSTARA
jgi:hypothetical protein